MVLQKCPFVLPNSSVDVLSQEGLLPANNPVWWARESGSSRGMWWHRLMDPVLLTDTSQRVSGSVETFPKIFWQSEDTSILTILPELGVLDLARRTNRGNQFHKQAHKTQMIAKTLWCFIDHHAFFPDTLWRRATERFRSSGKKKHNRWLFLIHKCGVSNYVWSQIRPDPPIC